MALSASDAFAARLAALSAAYPTVQDLTPSSYTAPDNRTYFSATFRLPGFELPFQTEASASPLGAARIVKQSIIQTLAQYAYRLPQNAPA